MGNSPAIYGGSRTKILTSKGLLLKDGTPIDFNGPKNYITKGTFATNATTGWSLKRTTLSGLIPNQVSASWTTPTVLTLSATTTGALTNSGYSLSLAASAATTAGDMLVSDAYTIDIEDQAKVLNFNFSYKAYANPSNMNFSGTSSNTLHVYIYDVTNNAWIQPTGCYTMVQNSGVGIGYGTFQTPSNMTQFRIAIVSCNASSGAFTMYFDNVFVGPQQFNMGPPVTDWVSYTPTGSWTSNVTYTGRWKRVGDQLYVYAKVVCSGAPNATFLSIAIPSGLTIDTTKVVGAFDTQTLGTGIILDSGVSAYVPVVVNYQSTTSVAVDTANVAGTYGNKVGVSNTLPFSFNTNDTVSIQFSVPIVGWSSNTVMSSDAATNVVAMRAKINASQTPGANFGARANILFGEKVYDTNLSYNTTTGQYTVPVAGYYRVTASVNFNHTGVVGSAFALLIQTGSTGSSGSPVTESLALESVAASGRQMVLNTSATIKVDAGSTINIAAYDVNTSPSIANNGLQGYLLIERISGPAQIAASETVAASFKTDTARTINNTAPTIIYDLIDYDTNGSYNNSTGIYTVPISGFYKISNFFRTAGISMGAIGYVVTSVVYVNGVSQKSIAGIRANTTTSSQYEASGSTTIKCNAGDLITIRIYADTAGTLATSQSAGNWTTIERIGGVM